MRAILLYITALAMYILSSCAGRTSGVQPGNCDSITMKYAKHINMVKYEDYTIVTLKDPWNKGMTLHTYILVNDKARLPKKLPDGTIIRIPLKKSVISTSAHCALLISLGKGSGISGVCDLKYIKIPQIISEVRKGKITDCGSSMAPAIEKIIELHPDAILMSPFQNSGGYGKLDKLNIPIIEAADYMEETALGRAEWIKFYGMLCGAEEKADSIFNAVESEYLRLKSLAQKSQTKRSILMDTKTGSVWYVPGGRSTIGKVIADASISYPFADDKSAGSLSLSFETVLECASNADIWLLRYSGDKPLTLYGLGSWHNGYKQFKAFKTGEVYGCNTTNSTFYEDTPFHPELLLRDFIIIAHPDLGIKSGTKYFHKLK